MIKRLIIITASAVLALGMLGSALAKQPQSGQPGNQEGGNGGGGLSGYEGHTGNQGG
jgi:hypothetical protein